MQAFVLTEETKVGEVEAFVFCPSEGTLPCFLAADASSRSCSSRHSCEAGATIRIYFVSARYTEYLLLQGSSNLLAVAVLLHSVCICSAANETILFAAFYLIVLHWWYFCRWVCPCLCVLHFLVRGTAVLSVQSLSITSLLAFLFPVICSMWQLHCSCIVSVFGLISVCDPSVRRSRCCAVPDACQLPFIPLLLRVCRCVPLTPRPPHVGLHFCLFRLSADFAPHQFVALRGVATTDEAFDVSANLGFSEAHYPVNSTP